MAFRSIVCPIGVTILVLGFAGSSLPHEVQGVESYYACQLTQAVAFLRSPNPGAENRDFPLAVIDAAGNPTGEHIVVITLENGSLSGARVTALGFAWPETAGGFQLVQLHQPYNQLTTTEVVAVGDRTIKVRTGFVTSGDYEAVRSVDMGPSQPDVAFSIRHDIRGVPAFPHTRLRFALVTGNTFSGGKPSAGLATDKVRHQIAVKGILPGGGEGSGNPALDIEQLLDDSYVRFRQVGPDDGSDTGIWRNLLPAPSCG